MHNFDLINKYKKQFNIIGHTGNNCNIITQEFIEKEKDTGVLQMIRSVAIKDLKRMVYQRMVKKRNVDVQKINELVIVVNDINEICNQVHQYFIRNNTVYSKSSVKSIVRIVLENDTQKEIKKLKNMLDCLEKQ